MARKNKRGGFTLIELLIVIAILSVLAVVVVLALNPTGLLQESRDGNRLSDMATLKSAIGDWQADGGASMGIANTVYVSLPDATATSSAGDQCQGLNLISLPVGYTYQCSSPSYYRLANGTGWIPINLAQASFGNPVSQLPIDPVNTSSSRLYYTYTTDGLGHFEATTGMEAVKDQLGGSADRIGTDGGTLASVYESGSKLGLEPLDYGDSSLVGYWTFQEGSGTVAYDYSGSGNSGALVNSPQWVAGKIGPGALSFNNNNTYVQLATSTQLTINTKTISFWANPIGVQTYNMILANNAGNYYVTFSGTGNMFASYSNGVGTQIANTISAGAVNAGAWGFYAFVFSVSGSNVTVQAYANGQLVGTQSRTDGYQTVVPSTFYLGTFSPSLYAFNGALDDVRVYNRALSGAQIAAMYGGGK